MALLTNWRGPGAAAPGERRPASRWGIDRCLDRQRRALRCALLEGMTLTPDQMRGLGHHFLNDAFTI